MKRLRMRTFYFPAQKILDSGISSKFYLKLNSALFTFISLATPYHNNLEEADTVKTLPGSSLARPTSSLATSYLLSCDSNNLAIT
jgi:hypothetical protein